MITIAPYTKSHRAATAKLWLDSFKSIGIDRPDDTTYADLETRLANEGEVRWDMYLGWREDELVAFLALNHNTSRLDQLFIAPAYKRQGIGEVLLDFAKEKLSGGMWLSTDIENQAGQRFYEKHGFQRGDTVEHPIWHHKTVIYFWPKRDCVTPQF